MPVAPSTPVARLLRDLVALPSVNPAFLSPGDPRAGEGRIGEFVAATAAAAGLDVEFQEVSPGRRNVIARLSPSGRTRRRVLLAPHLDTVGEPALDAQLSPRIATGRLHGRGACDTKGCVAAMLQAVCNLAAGGGRPAETEVTFVGLVDEENGQGGSRHYARAAVRSEYGAGFAIVGEPTRLEVVTAHKGDLWLQLRTCGRAAHGATPHLGRNAVTAMARAVLALEVDYAAELARRPAHPLLGRPTVNVGAIRGGTQPNIVPAECVISIDRRFLPGETAAGVRREIRAALRRAGVDAEFDDLRASACAALETDPGLPLVQTLLRAAGRRRVHGVHYFCDAAPLAAAGIPAVVFGPGDIAQAHTSDEWIELAQLGRAVAVLERFLRGLA